MKLYDFLIRGGRVIDPLLNKDRVEDVFISNSKIALPPQDNDYKIEETVDATGCMVLPGIIDFHSHVAYRFSEAGLNPDLYYLPNGITSAVDAGSAGTSNFESMIHDVVMHAMITIRNFLNISPTGLVTERFRENFDPAVFDVEKMRYLFELYSEYILGFKVRVGKNFSFTRGFEPLKSAMELGNQFDCPVYAHILYPEESIDTAMQYLRPGDIFSHFYQGQGDNTILDENGKIRKSVVEGRKRGVIFDSAAGSRGRSLKIAQKAIEQGFYPDIISADAVTFTVYRKWVFNQPRFMAEYYSMGMPLMEVVRASTQTPAKLMRMEESIGTLKPGAMADVAILKIEERPVDFEDLFDGSRYTGKYLFIPQMTFKAGRIAFKQINFMF
jgi:dihydroorotase